MLEYRLTYHGVKSAVLEREVMCIADDGRAWSPCDVHLHQFDIWSDEQGRETGSGDRAAHDEYTSGRLVLQELREPLVVLARPKVLRQGGQDGIERVDQRT